MSSAFFQHAVNSGSGPMVGLLVVLFIKGVDGLDFFSCPLQIIPGERGEINHVCFSIASSLLGIHVLPPHCASFRYFRGSPTATPIPKHLYMATAGRTYLSLACLTTLFPSVSQNTDAISVTHVCALPPPLLLQLHEAHPGVFLPTFFFSTYRQNLVSLGVLLHILTVRCRIS